MSDSNINMPVAYVAGQETVINATKLVDMASFTEQNVLDAARMRMSVRSAYANVRWDGTDPDGTTGYVVAEHEEFILEGNDNIRQFSVCLYTAAKVVSTSLFITLETG